MSERHVFDFGPVRVVLKGRLGAVFTPSPAFCDRFARLKPDVLRKANAEAWRVQREAARAMSRCSNITEHGSAPFAAACTRYDVAKAVHLETWKRLQGMPS